MFPPDIARERTPSDAARFEHAKLNHIETTEKQILPSKQGIFFQANRFYIVYDEFCICVSYICVFY